MPILSIRHVTTYHYNQPVAFGEHRMMLRPRDDGNQKVLESELEITPTPKQLAWMRDTFGNHVATAHFADRASELRFVSNIRLDHAPADFRATDIKDFARTYPFAYAAADWPDLERFIRPLPPHPAIDRWSAMFFRKDGSADTHDARRHDADHQADRRTRIAAREGHPGSGPDTQSRARQLS
jgi:transglutaminase-like putative cysteine protease